ncbi:hypothetical protein [Halobacillus ihumii]|uniref:hypothetical protein n=1 Tax=Halobacillus ihumii TaxID=2686092 RepID=UPI0013D2B7EC|nr:hypothetical protein [Halobacillus ihumii]
MRSIGLIFLLISLITMFFNLNFGSLLFGMGTFMLGTHNLHINKVLSYIYIVSGLVFIVYSIGSF